MNKLQKTVFVSSGIITILILAIVVLFILVNGISIIDLEFLFTNPLNSGKAGGIFPMIVSSIYLIVLTAIISVPIALSSAVYITYYCKSSKIINLIMFISQILSSVPSIIYGLFAFSFIVIFLKLGWSIFSASVVLSIMSIPTIFQVSEVSLRGVNNDLMEASLALGSSTSQAISKVILPSAAAGIFTGIILALTRAFSEAAAVMYVVGSTLTMPLSIFDTGRPLPLHLYILASEGISMDNAYGTAAVLIISIFIITFSANIILNKLKGGYSEVRS